MPPAELVIDEVRHPPLLFYAAGALALAVMIVMVLGMTVARGQIAAIDRAIMLAMRPPSVVAAAPSSGGFDDRYYRAWRWPGGRWAAGCASGTRKDRACCLKVRRVDHLAIKA